MRYYKYKLRKDFTDAEKIKKFDKILKVATKRVKTVTDENWGYEDIYEFMGEEVFEVLFGKKIFKILDEDKRGYVGVN